MLLAFGGPGLIKCICMLNYSSGAPNIHLLTLNPHLDVAGQSLRRLGTSSLKALSCPNPEASLSQAILCTSSPSC